MAAVRPIVPPSLKRRGRKPNVEEQATAAVRQAIREASPSQQIILKSAGLKHEAQVREPTFPTIGKLEAGGVSARATNPISFFTKDGKLKSAGHPHGTLGVARHEVGHFILNESVDSEHFTMEKVTRVQRSARGLRSLNLASDLSPGRRQQRAVTRKVREVVSTPLERRSSRVKDRNALTQSLVPGPRRRLSSQGIRPGKPVATEARQRQLQPVKPQRRFKVPRRKKQDCPR